MSRSIRAVAFAAICGLVLAGRVFLAIEPLRVKLVNSPVTAQAGAAQVRAGQPELNALQSPFAVIARIRHELPDSSSFSIQVDGRDVCDVQLASGAGHRVDCAMEGAWERTIEHEVRVSGPDVPWTLEYLEMATHHGNSGGIVTLFVLPARSVQYTKPPLVLPFLVALAVAGLFLRLRPDPPVRWLAWIDRALSGGVLTLFGLILIAPLASPYRVVISAGTFAGCVVVLALPYLWRPIGRTWEAGCASPARIAGGIAVGLCAFGLVYGSRALGAADTYGYVSEAELWRKGQLKIDQSFALQAPWPEPAWTFAPLGYRPHPKDNRVIVPNYSPGLPMILALAKIAGGQTAMFFIVPLFGALLVIATYRLGVLLGSAAVGLVGAWLVATSPLVLGYVLTAMTDVPVAAVWVAAFCFLFATGLRSAIGAGLLSGLAVLIRPNLAPLAAALTLHYLIQMRDPEHRKDAFIQLVAFVSCVVPGGVAVAAINWHLFGSPSASGYGGISDIFVVSRVLTNVQLYIGWLIETHTPLALVGLAAVAVPLRRLWPNVTDRSIFVVMGVFTIALWAIYCAWLVFDSWFFMRFMLPSVVFMMLGLGAVATAIAKAPVPLVRPLTIAAVVGLGIVQARFAFSHGVLDGPHLERRNIAVARLVRQATPPNSVIVSGIHTGSVRYYGGRMTMIWSNLDGQWLDRAIVWLDEHGAHPYLLLENIEIPEFRRRFAGAERLAALDEPPVGVYKDSGTLMLFDLTARESHGTPVVATGAPTGWWAVPPETPPMVRFSRR